MVYQSDERSLCHIFTKSRKSLTHTKRMWLYFLLSMIMRPSLNFNKTVHIWKQRSSKPAWCNWRWIKLPATVVHCVTSFYCFIKLNSPGSHGVISSKDYLGPFFPQLPKQMTEDSFAHSQPGMGSQAEELVGWLKPRVLFFACCFLFQVSTRSTRIWQHAA